MTIIDAGRDCIYNELFYGVPNGTAEGYKNDVAAWQGRVDREFSIQPPEQQYAWLFAQFQSFPKQTEATIAFLKHKVTKKEVITTEKTCAANREELDLARLNKFLNKVISPKNRTPDSCVSIFEAKEKKKNEIKKMKDRDADKSEPKPRLAFVQAIASRSKNPVRKGRMVIYQRFRKDKDGSFKAAIGELQSKIKNKISSQKSSVSRANFAYAMIEVNAFQHEKHWTAELAAYVKALLECKMTKKDSSPIPEFDLNRLNKFFNKIIKTQMRSFKAKKIRAANKTLPGSKTYPVPKPVTRRPTTRLPQSKKTIQAAEQPQAQSQQACASTPQVPVGRLTRIKNCISDLWKAFLKLLSKLFCCQDRRSV